MYKVELSTLSGHSGVVTSVAFSPDGTLLASRGADMTVRLWTVVVGTLVRTFSDYNNTPLAVVFSPDGQLLATAADHTLEIRSVATRQALHILSGHSGIVSAVAFSPDGIVKHSYDSPQRNSYQRL